MALEPTQPLNFSTSQPASDLVLAIRKRIQHSGPISFADFMSLALYHPEFGYYSSGHCVIGRRGDYFTNVSVGSVFGSLLAGQFVEIWEKLDRPTDFVIVEQGAHDGDFASDVLETLQARYPEFFARVIYRIVEPFAILRQKQEKKLNQFQSRVQWVVDLESLPAFSGIHFSNELLDAMPVHLLTAAGEPEKREWRQRSIDCMPLGFDFVECPISDPRLRACLTTLPPPPQGKYETEINLAALDWLKILTRKLQRGVALIADYGFSREDYYAPSRNTGTLQAYAQHRVLRSCLEQPGECDLSTHVEWTGLAERALELGLTIIGFADQHHFFTGLLSVDPDMAIVAAKKSRALQTLIHPEFLGTRFQFLGLGKELPKKISLGGFRFARDPRSTLGLA